MKRRQTEGKLRPQNIINVLNRSLLVAICAVAAVAAQAQKRTFEPTGKFTGITTFGTAIPLAGAAAAFEWQILGHYNPTEHWSVGAGTGISLYEKPLLPLYADVRYHIGRPRLFNAFLEMAGGYSFSLSREANGGLLVNPAVGVQCRLPKGLAVQLSVGWELQKIQLLRRGSNANFSSSFVEKLTLNSVTVRAGLKF